MNTHTTSRRLALIGAASLALIATACGSNSSATSASSTPTTASASATANLNTSGSQTTAVTAQVEKSPAGDIPDSQAFVTYSPAGANYSVKVPEGWARSESNGATSFTDKLNTVRMESSPMASAPTATSAGTSEFATIAKADPSATLGKVSNVSRPAGSVILVTYERNSAPSAVTGKVYREAVERYEFWKNGTLVVLTLSGPTGSDNLDPWKTVTTSFAWK